MWYQEGMRKPRRVHVCGLQRTYYYSVFQQGEKDIIMLVHGGHGFKVLKDIEMLEIKQGPYSLSKDKIKFQNVDENKIKIKK